MLIIKGKSKKKSMHDQHVALANKHQVPLEEIEDQVLIGEKEEMEHTEDKDEAHKIAMDHISEDPKYYIKLKAAGLIEKSRIIITRMRKAKYIKRTGSPGNYKYYYKDSKVSSKNKKSEKNNLIINEIEEKEKLVDGLKKVRDDYFSEYEDFKKKVISKYGSNNTEWPENILSEIGGKIIKFQSIDKKIRPLRNDIEDLKAAKRKIKKRDIKIESKRITDFKDSIEILMDKEKYLNYGLRINRENPKTGKKVRVNIGDIAERSYYQPDESITEISHGTSALKVGEKNIDKILRKLSIYTDGYLEIILLGSDSTDEGNDPGEIEMNDAEILSIYRPDKNMKKAIRPGIKYMFKKAWNSFMNIASPPAEYDRKYKLQGYIPWHGLMIAVENKKGSYRRGTDGDGKAWKTFMHYPYGRFQGTKATDNEHVDVYVGLDEEAEMVYVVHQNDPVTGRYDEDKVMVNFLSKEAAKAGYLSQYNRPGFLGSISEFTIKQFKEALEERRGAVLYRSPFLAKGEKRVVKAIIIKNKSLEYWKKRLIDSLQSDSMSKSLDDILYPSGAPDNVQSLLQKARGFPAGTIREWRGKKYKKLSSGKWVLTYSGKDTRGEKQAIKNVARKIQSAKDMTELARIISENIQRFKDEDGKTLPVIKEFITSARGTVAGKKSDKKPEQEKSGIENIKDKYQSAKTVEGDQDDISVGNEEISGTWKLVEADTPTASHDESTFNKTKGFPTNEDGSTINDRDYEKDKSAQEAVVSIASEFDGRALNFDSPVIISDDGVVISGNNRTMSSKIAARKGTDKKYINALKKRAKKFGFSSDDIDSFKNPRVVFEIDNKGDYSTKLFSKFNESATKAMSPIEAAVKMSKIITNDIVTGVADTIQEFDTIGELYADKKAVNDIFNTLQVGGIITSLNRPQYVTEGGITGAGKEFLETVLIGSVINETNIRNLNKEGVKSIRKKLVRAITPLIHNKSLGGYSISKELNDAISIITQVKTNKDFTSIDDYAKQSDMFSEKNDIAVEFARKLDMKEKEFAEFMQKMNSSLSIGAEGQADIFFGDVETKESVLDRMFSLAKSIFS